MNPTIITTSRSPHGNTRKIADVIAAELGATIHAPGPEATTAVAAADLVGFGSGIYWMNFRRSLRDFVASLPESEGKDAFFFATSGFPQPPVLARYMDGMQQTLEAIGFRVVGGFHCRGLDTMGPFGLIGGVNKSSPTASDLESAKAFAQHLVS